MFYAILVAVAVAWGAARHHPQIYRMDDRPVPSHVLINLACGFGFGLLVVLLTRYAARRWRCGRIWRTR